MAQSLTDSDRVPPTGETSIFHYQQGEAIANQGGYAEALAHFDQAISLQPDYGAAWVFRAVVLLHLQRYQEALVSCDRALAICPVDQEALLFRGVALHRLGYYPEAYASYRQALGKQKRSSWLQRAGKLARRWKTLVINPLMQGVFHP